MRKRIVFALVMVVVAGCGSRAAPRRAVGVARRPSAEVAAARVRGARQLVQSWSRTVAGSPGAVAADRDGTIAMVDDDKVVALDEDGFKRWSTPVPGAGLGWPSLGAGLVVVPTWRDDDGPGGCVALDRATGARRWTYEEQDSQGVAVARAGDDVLCALESGVVVAIDRETGAKRWRVVLADRYARAAPHVTVTIAQRSALAVDAATATLAIGVTVNSYPFVVLLDVAMGADRGSFHFTKLRGMSSPVSAAQGVLAVGVSPGSVCTLDIRHLRGRSCVVVASTADGFDLASIPLVAGNSLVIAAHSSVVAVDLAATRVLWKLPVPNPILDARPDVADGIVMFSDGSRVAWAARLSDGSPVTIPKAEGWVIATVADPGGGFDIAKRDLDGGWIEHWGPPV